MVWAREFLSCNLRFKMIAYEELDRALARWKARRSGGSETAESVAAGRTPDPVLVAAVASFQDRESTGEIDLVDEILDEA